MVLAQLRAAQESASAAWAAVAAYWAAFAATVVSLMVSSLIALVAIRGPERERHTRDLEIRSQRTRLYSRAALAGLRGLAVSRRLASYIAKHAPLTEAHAEDLKNLQRRLNVRRLVIDHFVAMEIRDTNLVGYLLEVNVFLDSLERGIDVPALTVGGNPTRDAEALLAHRKSRLANLRSELQDTASELRLKESSLQRDLERVWKLGWLFRFWERPETARD
ncbi:MAG TPA: hypothetical protein VMU59_10035 [Caulobacteraceae bacterium]|nr:hypothetical protein [Caulobacteraceae bacterium]